MAPTTKALFLVLGLLPEGVSAKPVGHGYKSSKAWLPRPAAAAPRQRPEVPLEFVTSVRNFDWRDMAGRNLVTSDVNQHIPQYCGSCWVHGTVAAFNDRVKIRRFGQFPDVMLSRQGVINCVPAPDGESPNPGCNGGDSWMIHKYLNEHRLPDESCLPYEAHNMECTAYNVCRNCFSPLEGKPKDEQCFAVKNWTGFGVSNYGNITGELAMMLEIFLGGPIACSAATDNLFMFNYSQNVVQHEGVYVTDQQYTEDDIDHVMEIAGWGQTASGVKYWVVRNSWGTYWGDMGWAKIRRGVNQQLIESSCDWAEPVFDDLDDALSGKVLGDYVTGINQVSAWQAAAAAKQDAASPAGRTDRSVVPPIIAAAAAKAAAASEQQQSQPQNGLGVAALLLTGAGGLAALGGVAVARGRQPRQPPLLG